MMKLDLTPYAFFKGQKESEATLLSSQGYSNKNYQFFYKNKKYLLRKFILQDRNRTLEFKVQRLAYENNIAAKPMVLDLENALMIAEFLEGKHKTELTHKELQSVVVLLHILHHIEVDETIDTLDVEKLFAVQTKVLKKAFSVLQRYPKTLALCHNDLNPKNILFSDENVKLIDWEFANVNDFYFDLAAFSVEYRLSVKDEAYFLENYFQSEGWEKEKLEAYKVIYKALCKEWFQSML